LIFVLSVRGRVDTGSQEAAFGRLLFVKAIQTGFSVGLGELADLLKDMFSRAALHGETGGMHCAALARRVPGSPQGWESIIREDVGRHNAVDKAIGRAIAEGWELRACALITSGRIAADMAIKAMNCGVPLLASRSIPTTTAYELAVRGGITLAGRIGSVNPSVYTHPERIRQEVPHVR
jgi:FdhD protein